jgi:hypothetical protein
MKDARGFSEYLTMKDAYEADVKIKMSSSAEKKCVWFYVKGGGIVASGGINDGAAHLTEAQARRVIKALQKFLEDA